MNLLPLYLSFLLYFSLIFPAAKAIAEPIGDMMISQKKIKRVELMPDIPQPFKMKNWRRLALDFDRFVFDARLKGEYLPLIWLDNTKINNDRSGFGLPSYVGAQNSTRANHEALTCIAVVLGATIAGIDKSKGLQNWVIMCENYFNLANGENLILNRTATKSGQSFWYELWPLILFNALVDRYPQFPSLAGIMKSCADRWYKACIVMSANGKAPDFNFTSFDFKTMQGVKNGKWLEPDCAAGLAWVQYMAWIKWREEKYLSAVDWCLNFLNELDEEKNPLYEILLPFGAVTAARMNAEHGGDFNLQKLLNWCISSDSAARPGWGVIASNWGGYDCHGLQGSLTDRGGYAFALTSLAFPAILLPIVRYDERYTVAMGKYFLNAANAARLFYADEHPPQRQSCFFWKGDPEHVIPYEGLRKEWKGKSPYAMGDPLQYSWGQKTDFGLYGGALVGFFGGIISRTNEEKILKLDCLATDFFHESAYPTYLYFNPHKEKKSVAIELAPGRFHLYDAVGNRFLHKNVSGRQEFTIAPKYALLLVMVPAQGKLTFSGRKTLINDVIIDYNNGRSLSSKIADGERWLEEVPHMLQKTDSQIGRGRPKIIPLWKRKEEFDAILVGSKERTQILTTNSGIYCGIIKVRLHESIKSIKGGKGKPGDILTIAVFKSKNRGILAAELKAYMQQQKGLFLLKRFTNKSPVDYLPGFFHVPSGTDWTPIIDEFRKNIK
ncbi:hypothetical protein ACFL35_15535 [Candidatus Riflebacteria bacterium]